MKRWRKTPGAKLSPPRMESEPRRGASFYVTACANKCMMWIRTDKALFLMILFVVLIALVPLYGFLFPPLHDLPEHIIISKLLWEKLSGVSHLDLEISWFLGYRLFPALMLIVIAFCKLWGVSFVYLPKIVPMALISLHAMVVVTILYFGLKDKSWKSCALAACISVPAIVCMYSACWFIGFVNYTLAITLLIPAVFLAERFLRSGKLIDASLLFFTLLMVYAAHPFAAAFWLLWCLSRALAGIATQTFFLEWKKLISLGLIFLPIFLYHFLATRATALAPSSHSLLSQPAIVSISDWYQNRIRGLFDGALLKADDAADSRFFARFAIGLILFATVLAFRATQSQRVKNVMLSSIFLMFVSSWVNEKFIPVPGGAWLAYDYRFSSTVYAIDLALAGMVLIRLIPVSTDKLQYKILFVVLALFSVVASVDHLMDVRKAYARFDAQARKYMAKIFNHEQPAGIYLPHSRWHPDGTLVKLYVCLEQPDCNPAGTTFFTGYVSDLYPVKLRSAKRVPTGPLVPGSSPIAGVSVFESGPGKGNGQFSLPRGLALDNAGNILVCDGGNGRIQKFSPAGIFLNIIGKTGQGPGEFREPGGIAVDSNGNIYVADVANQRVQKLKPDGTFLAEWKGPKPGFYGPRDVSIGPDNSVYVVDQGHSRIVKFDSNGKVLAVWGAAGQDDGQFVEPTSVAVNGKNNRVYVADPRSKRIEVFDTNGKFIAKWLVNEWGTPTGWYFQDLAVDSLGGFLYASSNATNDVLVFDLSGNKVKSLKPDQPDKVVGASSIALQKNSLYVVNTFSARVSRIDLETK
jgi:DNA-binding beta-propeller fold protein YncE